MMVGKVGCSMGREEQGKADRVSNGVRGKEEWAVTRGGRGDWVCEEIDLVAAADTKP